MPINEDDKYSVNDEHNVPIKHKRTIPVWQIIMLIIGLLLMSYPIIADQLSVRDASDEIQQYMETTVSINDDDISEILDNARAYNDKLAGIDDGYPSDQIKPYEQQISSNNGAFAWIEIPKLDERLPIYHGDGTSELESGVGHMEGTSLPIGGNSTHSVLSGHSGMPGSRMFDDIDKLENDDVFYIHILNNTLAYKVIGSEVVWPTEMQSLGIEENRDLCTLVTCTPYGVNDHRLLVHAERTDYEPDSESNIPGLPAIMNRRTLPFFIAILAIALFFLITQIVSMRRQSKNSDPESSITDSMRMRNTTKNPRSPIIVDNGSIDSDDNIFADVNVPNNRHGTERRR